MTQLSTLSDGETYADIRLGDTFIVSVDRTAHKDAITVRVFNPDQPDVAIGEHHLDLTLPEEGSATAPWDTTMGDEAQQTFKSAIDHPESDQAEL